MKKKLNSKKIVFQDIQQKIELAKQVTQEDINKLCEVLIDKNEEQNLRNEAVDIIKMLSKYEDTPQRLIDILWMIVKENNDPLATYIQKNLAHLIQEHTIYSRQLKKNVHSFGKNVNKIVTKTKVRQKRQYQMDETILEKNLKQQAANERKRKIAQVKRTQAQKLPKPKGGTNKEFWSTITKFLNLARSGVSLTKSDLEYIANELTSCLSDGKVYMGGFAHSLFGFSERMEILKYTTKNKQAIPKEIFSVIDAFLGKSFAIHKGKLLVFAIKLGGSLLLYHEKFIAEILSINYIYNYSLSYTLYHFAQHYKLPDTTIQVLKAIVNNEKICSEQLIIALATASKHSNFDNETVQVLEDVYKNRRLYTPKTQFALLAALAKNKSPLHEIEKVDAYLHDYLTADNNAVFFYLALLESYRLEASSINDDNTYFLDESLKISINKDNAYLFFGKSVEIFEPTSQATCYSWLDSNIKSIQKCAKKIDNKQKLSKTELLYLGKIVNEHIKKYDSNYDSLYIVSNALNVLQHVAKEGQLLPIDTIKNIAPLLKNNHFQRQIFLILGYALRNGQILSKFINSKFQEIYKQTKKSAQNFLSYYRDKYAIDDIPKIFIKELSDELKQYPSLLYTKYYKHFQDTLLSKLPNNTMHTNNALYFLQNCLAPITENNAQQMFGPLINTIPCFSTERRFFLLDTSFLSISKCLIIALMGIHLTKKELSYLGDKVKKYSITYNDDIYLLVHPALDALKVATCRGQELPASTIDILYKLLDNVDPTLQDKAWMILGYVLRNKQVLSPNKIEKINTLFDTTRIAAAEAISFFVQNYDIKLVPTSMMSNLSKAIEKAKNNVALQEALQDAMKEMLKKKMIFQKSL